MTKFRQMALAKYSSWIDGKVRRTHPLCAPILSKVFVMLVAYMDASGTHNDSHNCVIGGYWGGVNEWRRFERRWGSFLVSEGIKEFHAKEFWPRFNGERIGPYKGWSDQRHAKFIDQLLTIIETSKIIPFASGVIGEEWQALSEPHRDVVTGDIPSNAKKPILLPFHRAIHRTVSYCLPGKVMHFVLDEDAEPNAEHAMREALRRVKESYIGEPELERIGELSFADSEKACPLQAADLLVYEAHRYAKKYAANKDYPMRREYQRALRRFKTREDFLLYDAPRFKTLRAVIDDAAQQASAK